MKKYFILLSIITLLINGCASTGYFEHTPIAQKGNGMLYVYRPAASNPGRKPLLFNYPEVMIDGKSVGFLKYNEYLAVELPAGEHKVLITGLTKDADWSPRNVDYRVDITANKEYFLKFRVEFNLDEMVLFKPGPKYNISLYPVAADEAVYEIRETSLAD